jgi:hypothetical protein
MNNSAMPIYSVKLERKQTLWLDSRLWTEQKDQPILREILAASFSGKLYTEEGNRDWVFNNTPVFFIRDPTPFPLFIHTQKRNPQTNLKDATMFWDYLSTHQESIHQVRLPPHDPLSLELSDDGIGHDSLLR